MRPALMTLTLTALALAPVTASAQGDHRTRDAAPTEWTDSVRLTVGARYGDGFGPALSLHWGAMLGQPRQLDEDTVRGLYLSLGVAATAEAVFRVDAVEDALGEPGEELSVSPRLTIGPEFRVGRARGGFESSGYDVRLARPSSTIWFGLTPFVGFEETRAGEQTAAYGGRATLGFIDTDSAIGDVISGFQISGDYGHLAATGDAVFGFTLAITRGF